VDGWSYGEGGRQRVPDGRGLKWGWRGKRAGAGVHTETTRPPSHRAYPSIKPYCTPPWRILGRPKEQLVSSGPTERGGGRASGCYVSNTGVNVQHPVGRPEHRDDWTAGVQELRARAFAAAWR
jgi:hypothetical protein